jgi:hypothetical protein
MTISHTKNGKIVSISNKIVPPYELRFIKEANKSELINLYYLARAALAGTGKSPTRYDRMLWASSQFAKKYDSVTETGAYKDLNGMLS